MENHPSNETKVLSMKLDSCEECYSTLKKKILIMHGVDSVSIDREKDIVYVTGPLDAMTLVNNVAKLVKKVRLLPNYNTEKHSHSRNEGRDTNSHNFGYHEGSSKGKSAHKNFCRTDGRHDHKKEEEKKKEEHKCEDYIPIKIDERVCRDYYCKIHPKMNKITDSIPTDSSPLFGGGLPFYNGFGPYAAGRGSYSYPGSQGYAEQQPPQFGYRPPPRMLQYPFGFH